VGHTGRKEQENVKVSIFVHRLCRDKTLLTYLPFSSFSRRVVYFLQMQEGLDVTMSSLIYCTTYDSPNRHVVE
jgi:hypothetical protein